MVENTIKHGLEAQPEPVNIEISATTIDAALVLTVKDNGTQLHSTNAGLGLATGNIRERLARLYASQASLQLTNNDTKGVTATLVIPATTRVTR